MALRLSLSFLLHEINSAVIIASSEVNHNRLEKNHSYFSKAAAFSQLEVSFMAMKKKNLPELVPELFEHEEFGQFRYIKRDER